jgi:hypothetical protein
VLSVPLGTPDVTPANPETAVGIAPDEGVPEVGTDTLVRGLVSVGVCGLVEDESLKGLEVPPLSLIFEKSGLVVLYVVDPEIPSGESKLPLVVTYPTSPVVGSYCAV